MAEKKQRYVLVVSPAYIKRLRDGKTCAIVYPGADSGKVAKLNKVVDELRSAEHMTVTIIKPEELRVDWVEVSEVEEVRGGGSGGGTVSEEARSGDRRRRPRE